MYGRVARSGRARGAIALLAATALAVVVTGFWTHGADGALVSTSADAGASGSVCGPTDRAGILSVGIEGVRNATSHDVTVTDVSFDGPHAKVIGWFLERQLTHGGTQGGVIAGRFGEHDTSLRLSPTLHGHQSALVAMTLQSLGRPDGQAVPVIVTYRTSHGSSSVRLAFDVGLVPHGQSCALPGDAA